MLTFLNIVLSFGIGFVIGSKWRQHKMIMQLVDNPDTMLAAVDKIKKIMESAETDIIEVYAEQHNDRWFIYNKQSHVFLSQGESVLLALAAAKERYPDTIFHQSLEGNLP